MPIHNILVTDNITPGEYGLPPKFASWRPGQQLCVERNIRDPRRVLAHAMPTGTGKSASYIASIKALSLMHSGPRPFRAAILTSTKGLQQQLVDDFSSIGLKSVMGRQNFTCISLKDNSNCEEGSRCGCAANNKKTMDSLCPYRRQQAEAAAAEIVVTNYSYWMSIHKSTVGEGLGSFDLLILDEGHDAPDSVCDFLAVPLSNQEVLGMLEGEWPKVPSYIQGWIEWAKTYLSVASDQHDRAVSIAQATKSRAAAQKARSWFYLLNKLTTLSELHGEWVVEPRMARDRQNTDGFLISPVWPRDYTERILFLGIPKILIFSATLSEATLRLLGVKTVDYTYYEYPSPFNPGRSPNFFYPVVKLNYKSGAEDYFLLIEAMDEIIEGRLDRKGIIHTTSYDRAARILQGSRYAAYMMTHSNRTGDSMRTFREFREAEPPALLVSPSMTTGFDFPLDACEYQIVVKAPYADLRSRVQTRRREKDQLYPIYVMGQTLVQTSGRGMRSADDQCETFVLDAAVGEAVKRAPKLFPLWWRNLIVHTNAVPDPPPALVRSPYR